MNSGKTLSIATTPQLMDMEGLFGSSDSIVTSKGTIFYCETDKGHSYKARSTAGSIALAGFHWIQEGAKFEVNEASGSVNYSLNDLRVGEHIPLLDSGGSIVGFGIVDYKDATTAKIGVMAVLGDITTVSTINIYADSFLEAGEQLEVPIGVRYISMVGSTPSDSIVVHTGVLKKKANSGLGSGGGGGGDLYTNGTPTPTTIGGISAGTTFLNQTMQQMWDALLYPYQAPSFTSFGVSGNNPLEVGETLPANQTATWATSNSGNVNVNSVDINNISPPFTNLVTGTANDGSEVLPQGAITHNTESINTWQIRATDSHGSNFNRNYSKSWYWRMYYGEDVNTTLTGATLKLLRASLLTNSYTRNYAMQSGSTYKYIAYPTSFGTATNFTDTDTGFAVAMEAPYTVSVTNAYGVTTDYNVHRSTNILNSAITIAVS